MYKLRSLKNEIRREITWHEENSRPIPNHILMCTIGSIPGFDDPTYYLADNETKYVLYYLYPNKKYIKKSEKYLKIEKSIDLLREFSDKQVVSAMPFLLAPRFYRKETCAVFLARCVIRDIPVDTDKIFQYLPENAEIRDWLTSFLEAGCDQRRIMLEE